VAADVQLRLPALISVEPQQVGADRADVVGRRGGQDLFSIGLEADAQLLVFGNVVFGRVTAVVFATKEGAASQDRGEGEEHYELRVPHATKLSGLGPRYSEMSASSDEVAAFQACELSYGVECTIEWCNDFLKAVI